MTSSSTSSGRAAEQAGQGRGQIVAVVGEPNPNGDFAGNGVCDRGRAAALAFVREGARVAAADVSEQGNQETARLIEEQGGLELERP